jgi:hypothetical protein
MVDVLHAYFEEDYTPYFEEGVQVKGKMREAIYSTLYHEEYKWRIDDTTTASMSIPEADGSTPQAQREPLREAPRYTRMPSEGMAASAVNPETGTMDLPEGTKRADPAKRLPRVQSATSMEDLSGVLGQPLG